MAAAQDAKPKIQVLTPEDLEAALRMLAEEERVAPPKARGGIGNLASSLFDNLVTAVFYSSLWTGIIVVWFRFWWGLKLFGLAAIAFILITLKAFAVGQEKDFDLLRSSPLAQMAQKAWSKKFQTEGCVIIPGCLLWWGGLIWLLVGLIVGWDVFPKLLIPVVVGSLIMAIPAAINRHRRFRYISRVGRLKERLQLLSEVEPEQVSAGINVSKKDRELLSQVEIRQVNRAAAENFEEYRKQLTAESKVGAWYSVAIGPGPLEYLGKLAESSRHDLRQVLDDLQLEPHPANARPVSPRAEWEDKETLVLEAGKYVITYVVDKVRDRVDVIEISETLREVQHAS